MKQIHSISKFILITFCCFSIAACLKPYQPKVTQGNKVNNSDLAQLRPGMSKREVLYILGTPMVNDPFLQKRWDYYYSELDRRKNKTSTRVITVIFDGDALQNLEGDISLEQLSTLEPSEEDVQYGGTIINEQYKKNKKRSTKKNN